MKKIKQSSSKSSFNLAVFKPEIKASRITINSRICNQDKFNLFFNILDLTKEYKNIIRLEKLILSYEKMIKIYEDIKQFKLNKPIIYNRLINLITNKKLRLLTKVKLAQYQTGTHARHLDNAQISIVKDLTNAKYQYFLKIRKNSTLVSREPKLKISNETVNELKITNQIKNKTDYELKLAKYNEDNFIYLPLAFNHQKLKQIGRTLDTILSKDNPQILLKSEQLRIGQSSRKIHLIFKYQESSKLGEIIQNNQFVDPNEGNTLGLDVNIKYKLLADSNGKFYDDLLKLGDEDKKEVDSKINKKVITKNKLIENINEIVLLQSIEFLKRTAKQKYRYEKLLRCNESLLKTYLSGLIKDWKEQNILHLVLEDLNIIGDKSYYEHQGVKIKYSRLSRLLRLSQIKLWITSMAEKQGLFTHLVNPAYTSQECSICHNVDHKNRLKQEIFKCTNKACIKHNVEVNADVNSALNIKSRVLHKELRAKLNKDNVYLCSRPKPVYYKNIKNIINDVYKSPGVVTELLPMNTINRIQLKEASSFRAR